MSWKPPWSSPGCIGGSHAALNLRLLAIGPTGTAVRRGARLRIPVMRRSTILFQELDADGRFHRDSPLGRIFHPGAVSFRQVSATDSLHVAVHDGNRVSVHVDRVSPLLVRVGRRCRYSLARAIVHNAVHLAEGVGRLVRRQRGRHACHLDCEIVWVPDDALDCLEEHEAESVA